MPLHSCALRAWSDRKRLRARGCVGDSSLGWLGRVPPAPSPRPAGHRRDRTGSARVRLVVGFPAPELRRQLRLRALEEHGDLSPCGVGLGLKPKSGRIKVGRVVSATDSEAAVSRDGIRIQAKGGIVQRLSRAIYEWGDRRLQPLTSIGWSSYWCYPSKGCLIRSTCMSSTPGRAVPKRGRGHPGAGDHQ